MNEQWKILMDTSPTATWFQSEEAYNCFVSCTSWLEPYLVQVHRGERLVGSLLGYVTKERCRIKQFFTARAVVFGGPLLAEDITDDELTQLLQLAIAHQPSAIYTEIRNFHDYSRWRSVFEQVGWTYVPHYDIHISCRDKETMMAHIHESKMRAIRKAQTQGETWAEATNEEQLKQWYKQLRHLYKTKIHRPLWPLNFFLHLWKQGYAKLLIIVSKSDALPASERGGIFCVKDGRSLYEWYICGSTMVTFGALEYANEQGLTRFDLMGAGEPNVPYGVRDFKMQFGGELKEIGRYQIIGKPLLYRLGKAFISFTSHL